MGRLVTFSDLHVDGVDRRGSCALTTRLRYETAGFLLVLAAPGQGSLDVAVLHLHPRALHQGNSWLSVLNDSSRGSAPGYRITLASKVPYHQVDEEPLHVGALVRSLLNFEFCQFWENPGWPDSVAHQSPQ